RGLLDDEAAFLQLADERGDRRPREPGQARELAPARGAPPPESVDHTSLVALAEPLERSRPPHGGNHLAICGPLSRTPRKSRRTRREFRRSQSSGSCSPSAAEPAGVNVTVSRSIRCPSTASTRKCIPSWRTSSPGSAGRPSAPKTKPPTVWKSSTGSETAN